MLNSLHCVHMDFAADFYLKIQSILENSSELNLPHTFQGWKLAVDIYENHENIIFVAEVAGIKEDAMKIMVNPTTVHFSGYRGPTCQHSPGFYHRMEIPTGHFSRIFSLPLKVRAEKGQAKMADGMLYLILPKLDPTSYQARF